MKKLLYRIYLVVGVIAVVLGYNFYTSSVTQKNFSLDYLTGEVMKMDGGWI